jgi:hypothetical protein
VVVTQHPPGSANRVFLDLSSILVTTIKRNKKKKKLDIKNFSKIFGYFPLRNKP